MISRLARHEQRYFLVAGLNNISKRFLPQRAPSELYSTFKQSNATISACIAILRAIVSTPSTAMNSMLSDWVLKLPTEGVDMYRAVVSVLSTEEQERVLQKSWEQFGDSLWIRHTPVVQQEGL